MEFLGAAAYELSSLGAAWALARTVADPRNPVAIIYLTMFLRLVLVSVVAGVLIQFHWTSRHDFLISIFIVLAGSICVQARNRRRADPAIPRVNGLNRTATSILIAGVALLTPVFIANAHFPVDIDSWAAYESVLDWANGASTVLQHTWAYPGIWELQYVALDTLGGAPTLTWVPGAWTVLAIPFMSFEIARRCELPESPAALLAIASVSIYIFWGGPSGIWTFKNDMIYAASSLGLVLSVLQVRDDGLTRSNLILFALSSSLLVVKYSGVPLILALALPIAAFLASNRRLTGRTMLTLLIAALAVSSVTTLPYYFENIFVHSNPLYPVKISLLFFDLPGHENLAGTSIFSHIDENVVLKTIFGVQPIPSTTGLLYGPFWSLACLGGLAVAVLRLVLLQSLKARDFVLISGALSILLYFSSYYSAGSAPDNLFYLLYENTSIRYALGAVILCEIGVVALLWQFGPLGRLSALLAVLLQIGSRFWILYFQNLRAETPTAYFSWSELTGILLGATLVTVGLVILYRAYGLGCSVLTAATTTAILGGVLVAEKLPGTLMNLDWGVSAAISKLHNAPRGAVRLVKGTPYCQFYSLRYPIHIDPRLTVSAAPKDANAYADLRAPVVSGLSDEVPQYLLIYHANLNACEKIETIVEEISAQGYQELVRSDQVLLWRRKEAG